LDHKTTELSYNATIDDINEICSTVDSN